MVVVGTHFTCLLIVVLLVEILALVCSIVFSIFAPIPNVNVKPCSFFRFLGFFREPEGPVPPLATSIPMRQSTPRVRSRFDQRLGALDTRRWALFGRWETAVAHIFALVVVLSG